MNNCLHRKYVSIAQSIGCDSYWMDTPCIPQNYQLRKEAINNINTTFAWSILTLVVDRDIMTIDVDQGISLETYELLLATLVVSD